LRIHLFGTFCTIGELNRNWQEGLNRGSARRIISTKDNINFQHAVTPETTSRPTWLQTTWINTIIMKEIFPYRDFQKLSRICSVVDIFIQFSFPQKMKAFLSLFSRFFIIWEASYFVKALHPWPFYPKDIIVKTAFNTEPVFRISRFSFGTKISLCRKIKGG
jgi:hypothetical protein